MTLSYSFAPLVAALQRVALLRMRSSYIYLSHLHTSSVLCYPLYDFLLSRVRPSRPLAKVTKVQKYRTENYSFSEVLDSHDLLYVSGKR